MYICMLNTFLPITRHLYSRVHNTCEAQAIARHLPLSSG
jgi:hypothetical protein